MEQLLQVGVITSTHGLKGEVKVYPTTDDAARFRKLKSIFLETGKELLPLEVERVKFFKQYVIVKFQGLDDISDVQKFIKKGLWVERKYAVALEENEYFIADLLGMRVETDDGKQGVLKDVLQTGANEVYVIEFEQLGEVLVPAIRSCILSVDVENMQMRVHLLEGLI